jgi:hypothetical protein
MSGQHTSEPMPAGIAVALMLLLCGVGLYSWATGFTVRWRRTLRWGRLGPGCPVGPTLSRWSHASAGLMLLLLPFSVIAPLAGLWASQPLLSTLTSISAAGMIAGMLYDWIRYKLQK